MEKLDLKDRKILYVLDKNSRQSIRSIYKKVSLSKDVVANQVKTEKSGIIKLFYPRYDTLQLGLNFLRFYFKFPYFTLLN